MKPTILLFAWNIEGVVGDLEAVVKDGLLDSTQGVRLIDRIAGVANHLAVVAIDEAIAQGGDPDKIEEAQLYLTEGDALTEASAFKDAVSKYKDALAKAESALP